MPVHDWERVGPAVFRDFQLAWTVHLSDALNSGVLPDSNYAMIEQTAGELAADPVLTSHSEADRCAARRRTLTIRHASTDRIVALVEILSPGNKSKKSAFDAFLDKALSALKHGYHLLLIDLFPPGRFDPQGIHGALWAEIEDSSFELPPHKNRTLAAYTAGITPAGYVEPIAVGQVLADIRLFLTPELYVNTPLELTYEQAWNGVPRRWRAVVEGDG